MSEEGQAAPTEGEAAPNPGEGASTVWTDGFPEELAGYIESKGFKTAQDVATSYQHLEALRGVPAEQIVKIPSDQSNREEMLPVYTKLGLPETPGDYTNVLGEGFNDDAFKGIAARAHELGLGDGQFQGLQQIVSEQVVAQQEAISADTLAKFDAWKSNDPDGYNNAGRLMSGVGVTEEGLDGILEGDKAALYEFLSKAAQKIGDAQVIQGDPVDGEGGFTMSPSAAKSKIGTLMADKDFQEQYYSDNIKIRQPAIDRMIKLQEAAARA